MYRFAAYPITQYFVLTKRVTHSVLESEGGEGNTYIVEKGPLLFPRLGWKCTVSFFAFDLELQCSNKYTVYETQVTARHPLHFTHSPPCPLAFPVNATTQCYSPLLRQPPACF